ncbi:MAG: hypothetical protein IE931_12490 [Sphingobacteriales bacterium]|nr:hypothetical protein [Sphingobacteriales bacterium]
MSIKYQDVSIKYQDVSIKYQDVSIKYQDPINYTNSFDSLFYFYLFMLF